MSSFKNTRLVYSSDKSHLRICQFCKVDPCRCRKPVAVVPEKTTLKLRLEKNSRGGKLVTVLFNLPHSPDYFTTLTKKLKSLCGAGGSFKSADASGEVQIEIQGDHRERISTYLKTLGFVVKLAGG